MNLEDLIGKTVDRLHVDLGYDPVIVFTDGTVLGWDHDGCEYVYTAEEWSRVDRS